MSIINSYYFNTIEEFNLSIFKISKEHNFNLSNVEIIFSKLVKGKTYEEMKKYKYLDPIKEVIMFPSELTHSPKRIIGSNIKSLVGAFFLDSFLNKKYNKLEYISNTLLEKLVSLEDVSFTFSDTRIKRLSSKIFKGNRFLKYLHSTFKNCNKLMSISGKLFKNNKFIKTFESTFESCSSLFTLPRYLFWENINCRSFKKTFFCSYYLTKLPNFLFPKYNIFKVFFDYCFAITNIKQIKKEIFKTSNNAYSFIGTFSDCVLNNYIIKNIFRYNKKARFFEKTFSNNGIIFYPKNIIKSKNILSTKSMFLINTKLKYINKPYKKSKSKVNNKMMYYGCENAVRIIGKNFIKNLNSKNIDEIFYRNFKLILVERGISHNEY